MTNSQSLTESLSLTEGQSLLARIESRLGVIEKDLWGMSEDLHLVQRDSLYKLQGHSTLQSYFESLGQYTSRYYFNMIRTHKFTLQFPSEFLPILRKVPFTQVLQIASRDFPVERGYDLILWALSGRTVLDVREMCSRVLLNPESSLEELEGELQIIANSPVGDQVSFTFRLPFDQADLVKRVLSQVVKDQGFKGRFRYSEAFFYVMNWYGERATSC